LRDPGGLLSEDREIELKSQARSSPSSHSTSSNSLVHHAHSTPLHRTPTQTSYDVPSLQDAGGLISTRLDASLARTSTHASYDVPSLQDAGGLLSSFPPSK
jgi:hypothetical protein